MPETMEISDAARSGDGSTQNVGIKAMEPEVKTEAKQVDLQVDLSWTLVTSELISVRRIFSGEP